MPTSLKLRVSRGCRRLVRTNRVFDLGGPVGADGKATPKRKTTDVKLLQMEVIAVRPPFSEGFTRSQATYTCAHA